MDQLTRLLWLIAVEVAIVALLALCDTRLPGTLARTRRTLGALPGRSFLICLVNAAFFGVLGAALLAPGGVVALVGGTIVTLLLACLAVGLAAAARIVGERLRPDAPDPLRQFLVGALVLVLASSVPLVGWFVVFPIAGLTGFGALLIALVQRRGTVDVPPTPPPLPWESQKG